MSNLYICVALYAMEGKKDELRRDLIAVVEPSRKEEANLRYELFVDRDDVRRFVFVEQWASFETRHKHHTESEHINRLHQSGAVNVERNDVNASNARHQSALAPPGTSFDAAERIIAILRSAMGLVDGFLFCSGCRS